ncbi:hypothetical protein PHYPSEUDO_002929 [Phytophthora pseudosyringae]|uniref:Cell death regulator Aven n=1 Tax=Phytophthora pseudosyringae TaxID=221518 RepID=A0A8T1VS25_9STRA|nr:hypothetical protein PHYPSEUDO_002929 [Phytophthora pseudosyringae]
MGRSQVKYRAAHGRGRGRGRGDAPGGRGGASAKRQPSHLRSLGSNAYRFEEREDQDDAGDQSPQDDGGRTQFFASEQNYRAQMGAAPGEYFQSRAMKQWEEKDDAVDDQGAVGVLDLDWIASQLELVSPDVRYRMDPKYCIDLPFEPQDEDGAASEEQEVSKKARGATPAVADAASTPAPAAAPSKPAQGDAELDFLLTLSAPTSGGATPTTAMPVAAAPVPARNAAEAEQLEDWLDDVLDM